MNLYPDINDAIQTVIDTNWDKCKFRKEGNGCTFILPTFTVRFNATYSFNDVLQKYEDLDSNVWEMTVRPALYTSYQSFGLGDMIDLSDQSNIHLAFGSSADVVVTLQFCFQVDRLGCNFFLYEEDRIIKKSDADWIIDVYYNQERITAAYGYRVNFTLENLPFEQLYEALTPDGLYHAEVRLPSVNNFDMGSSRMLLTTPIKFHTPLEDPPSDLAVPAFVIACAAAGAVVIHMCVHGFWRRAAHSYSHV